MGLWSHGSQCVRAGQDHSSNAVEEWDRRGIYNESIDDADATGDNSAKLRAAASATSMVLCVFTNSLSCPTVRVTGIRAHLFLPPRRLWRYVEEPQGG